jgi:hypothetical protein
VRSRRYGQRWWPFGEGKGDLSFFFPFNSNLNDWWELIARQRERETLWNSVAGSPIHCLSLRRPSSSFVLY